VGILLPILFDSGKQSSAVAATTEKIKKTPQIKEKPDKKQSDKSMAEKQLPVKKSSSTTMIDLSQKKPEAASREEAVPDFESSSPYDSLVEKVNNLRKKNKCPVVLIGALTPADASPRFAVNLAIALTRKSLRVLLVEADQDSSDLAEVFGLDKGPGFFEWRRGEAWVSRTVHDTQLSGLKVMLSGTTSVEQNSETLDIKKELHRWGNLSNNFDVVLLYSPAALSEKLQTPAQIAATQSLELTEGVFCLTRNKSHLPLVETKINSMLEEHKAQLLGAVVVKK
jgi:Mrp family chromosome partitioning ATPase